MFVVSLTYTVALSEVDQYIDAHIAYLEKQYAEGHFLASGRKVPRTGGIILARANDRAHLDAILRADPFYQAGVADYDIMEFEPSMTAEGLDGLKK
ncbi:YciI family protein [Enterovibrio norvegicus]|uniref:YciI family protein n=1 Tax=Enterovibrio norvegicus TaxID=188144 RepID=UPI00389A21B9